MSFAVNAGATAVPFASVTTETVFEPLEAKTPLAPDDVWLGREWLLTDGLGGFASGTAADCASRRYHGWLCAPVVQHGARRHLFLARLDEVAVTQDVIMVFLRAIRKSSRPKMSL